MQAAPVVGILDEAGEMRGRILEALLLHGVERGGRCALSMSMGRCLARRRCCAARWCCQVPLVPADVFTGLGLRPDDLAANSGVLAVCDHTNAMAVVALTALPARLGGRTWTGE